MTKGSVRIGACLAWALVTLAGCGGASLVPVEGTVTLDDKPLPNATVTLAQVQASAPGPFTDETDSEGRFALGPVGKDGNGAVVGDYFVMITTVKQAPGGMEGTPLPTEREIVPVSWRNGSQRFQVPEGGTKQANFEMKSR